MFKRFLQFTLAFVAVAFFVLAPLACQQADKADDTGAAKPAGDAGGKKLMAAKSKAKEVVDEAGEAVDDAGEAVDDAGEAVDDANEALEDAGEALDDAVEEGAEAVEDETKGY
jgi:uncharacterized protein YoxC